MTAPSSHRALPVEADVLKSGLRRYGPTQQFKNGLAFRPPKGICRDVSGWERQVSTRGSRTESAGAGEGRAGSEPPRKTCLSDKCCQDRWAVSGEATEGHTDSPPLHGYGCALRVKH